MNHKPFFLQFVAAVRESCIRYALIVVMQLSMVALASAQSYTYLTVSNSGEETSYELANISRITFDTDNLVLWNGEVRLGELPLASLDKMFFSATNSLSPVSIAKAQTKLRNGRLTVTASVGTRIGIYDMRGRVLKEVTTSAEETEINLDGMRHGVYIVKVGDSAQKFMSH